MDFRYLPGMHFPQKYDHNRLQGRPHKKNLNYFKHKKNVMNVETEKEDKKWSLVSILL